MGCSCSENKKDIKQELFIILSFGPIMFNCAILFLSLFTPYVFSVLKSVKEIDKNLLFLMGSTISPV